MIVIIPTISGWFIGYNYGHSDSMKFLFGAIGISLGFLAGLFLSVLYGGIIAVFLKIDENIQKIVDKLEQGDQTIMEKIDENTQKIIENTDIARKQGKLLNHIRIFLSENFPR